MIITSFSLPSHIGYDIYTLLTARDSAFMSSLRLSSDFVLEASRDNVKPWTKWQPPSLITTCSGQMLQPGQGYMRAVMLAGCSSAGWRGELEGAHQSGTVVGDGAGVLWDLPLSGSDDHRAVRGAGVMLRGCTTPRCFAPSLLLCVKHRTVPLRGACVAVARAAHVLLKWITLGTKLHKKTYFFSMQNHKSMLVFHAQFRIFAFENVACGSLM